jgi:uncharacterized membrane protein
MIPQALALALGAAVLHAAWNVRLKTSGDPLRAAMGATTASALALAPLGCVAWLLTGRPGIPASVWALVVLSALAELAYLILLSTAYGRGELSHIYPLARGTAPVLAVLAGLALGERLHWEGYVGVALVLAGLIAARPPRAASRATWYAILTGVCIAGYSTVDSVGVKHVEPWLYGWAMWTGTAVLVAAWASGTRSSQWKRSAAAALAGGVQRPPWPADLVMGTMMAVPYLMVLVALSWAPLLIVAPVRESAIVLVTVWSILRLGERARAPWRVAGATAVVAGIVLIAAW